MTLEFIYIYIYSGTLVMVLNNCSRFLPCFYFTLFDKQPMVSQLIEARPPRVFLKSDIQLKGKGLP